MILLSWRKPGWKGESLLRWENSKIIKISPRFWYRNYKYRAIMMIRKTLMKMNYSFHPAGAIHIVVASCHPHRIHFRCWLTPKQNITLKVVHGMSRGSPWDSSLWWWSFYLCLFDSFLKCKSFRFCWCNLLCEASFPTRCLISV